MNKKIKERWVKALRSGEFEQGIGNLCRVSPDGKRTYCCLGVLSQLAVRSHVIPKGQFHGNYDDDGVDLYSFGEDESVHYTPTEVQEWAGLDCHNPRVDGHSLADYNDGNEWAGVPKKNFNEIADLIEENL